MIYEGHLHVYIRFLALRYFLKAIFIRSSVNHFRNYKFSKCSVPHIYI